MMRLRGSPFLPSFGMGRRRRGRRCRPRRRLARALRPASRGAQAQSGLELRLAWTPPEFPEQGGASCGCFCCPIRRRRCVVCVSFGGVRAAPPSRAPRTCLQRRRSPGCSGPLVDRRRSKRETQRNQGGRSVVFRTFPVHLSVRVSLSSAAHCFRRNPSPRSIIGLSVLKFACPISCCYCLPSAPPGFPRWQFCSHVAFSWLFVRRDCTRTQKQFLAAASICYCFTGPSVSHGDLTLCKKNSLLHFRVFSNGARQSCRAVFRSLRL